MGPFDLRSEDVEVSITHRGRQRAGVVSLLDESSALICEVRSDHASAWLWARDNRGHHYQSAIEVEDHWWRTQIRVSQGHVRISTARDSGDEKPEDWCAAIVLWRLRLDLTQSLLAGRRLYLITRTPITAHCVR